MASFKKYYRTLFDTFGYPLTERTALSSEVLAAAQKRLGVRIPAALRDFYRYHACLTEPWDGPAALAFNRRAGGGGPPGPEWPPAVALRGLGRRVGVLRLRGRC